jgi:hypothetical protein
MADGGESPVDRGILSQQEVSDRLEILDLLATYCRGIDERDFDLLWSVFTPDSTIDYSRAGGISGTAAEAIAWVTESLRSSQWSQHVVTLRDLELTSESGTALSYYYNPTVLHSDNGGFVAMVVGGYYRDHLIHTAQGWRIMERSVDKIWQTPLWEQRDLTKG